MKKTLLLVTGAVAVICVSAGAVVWSQAAPSIGEVNATPAYVVVNEPTDVLFTARIDAPTVITTGVNLLSVDASGRTLGTVGVMRDDGRNGDAVAGDRIFSLRQTMYQPIASEAYYRVSAAFKGLLQRVLSRPVVVNVWNLVTSQSSNLPVDIPYPPSWTATLISGPSGQPAVYFAPMTEEFPSGITAVVTPDTSLGDVLAEIRNGARVISESNRINSREWTVIRYESTQTGNTFVSALSQDGLSLIALTAEDTPRNEVLVSTMTAVIR